MHEKTTVVSAALRAVGNIVTGDDVQTQVSIRCFERLVANCFEMLDFVYATNIFYDYCSCIHLKLVHTPKVSAYGKLHEISYHEVALLNLVEVNNQSATRNIIGLQVLQILEL